MPRHFLFGILILLLGAFAILQCDDVIVSPSPAFPMGNHSGVYTRAVQGTDSSIYLSINLLFTDNDFYFENDLSHYPSKDTTKAPDPSAICDWAGTYRLEGDSLLELSYLAGDSAHAPRSCKGPYAPYGTYRVDRSKKGGVTLTNISENPQGKTVTRTIWLGTN